MDGRIVHLRVSCFQKAYNLASCPDDGAVAMGCHHVNGTVAVEGAVEAHARTNTYILYLSTVVNLC